MRRQEPNVAKFVKLARTALRFSQKEMADALGLSCPSSIAKYESGLSMPSGLTVLVIISILSEKHAAKIIYEAL